MVLKNYISTKNDLSVFRKDSKIISMKKTPLIFTAFAIMLMAAGTLFASDKKALEWFPQEIKNSSPEDVRRIDISPGVEYGYVYCTNLFGHPGDLHVIKIDIKKSKLIPVFEERSILDRERRLRRTSDAADDVDSLISVNGGFFTWKNLIPYYPAKLNGKILESECNKNGKPDFKGGYGLAFNSDGSDLYLGNISVEEEGRWENFLCSERFVSNGKVALEMPKSKTIKTKPEAPRTLMGQDAERKYLWIFVSGGRQKGVKPSMGLSYHDAAEVITWFGCTEGINFDGGGSTTLVIDEDALERIKKPYNPEAHEAADDDYIIMNCTSDGNERRILDNIHFVKPKKRGGRYYDDDDDDAAKMKTTSLWGM